MKKQRIHLEYELHSSSPNIIWPLISNEAGLQKWIANTVTREGDKLTFTWGEEWSHHEQRTATIVEEKKMKLIRLEWDDEAGEEDNFWQMEMVRRRLMRLTQLLQRPQETVRILMLRTRISLA